MTAIVCPPPGLLDTRLFRGNRQLGLGVTPRNIHHALVDEVKEMGAKILVLPILLTTSKNLNVPLPPVLLEVIHKTLVPSKNLLAPLFIRVHVTTVMIGSDGKWRVHLIATNQPTSLKARDSLVFSLYWWSTP